MNEFLSTYKLPILFGVLGLILAVLWLSVGFFKTLLIILMVAIGVRVGFYLKETKLMDHYFKS
ncbi:DUF2273 domain-containing protein [Enterococcus sp. AZ196]|uniref:DUF2273 domain-containing protein n=1 Tax=Enterococcus sp. AZ196 TaxID=2774659 RepID=UPI003D2A9186